MISSTTFPAAFAAMDTAAAEFWAYPDAEWQNNFLAQWALENQDAALLAALDGSTVL